MYIKINTTGIQEATRNAAHAADEARRIALTTQLATYKTETIPILGQKRLLPEEKKKAAADIAKQLQDKGWLREIDRNWCSEQGIEI